MAQIAKEGRRTLIEFPDCPGCQTFADRSGDTASTARDALEGWLELHLEDGDVPPKPRRRRAGKSLLPVRIDAVLAVRLQIRWARADRGMSQGDLARVLGVSRQQVSLLEHPSSNVTLGTLQKVADALDLQLNITLQPKSDASAA